MFANKLGSSAVLKEGYKVFQNNQETILKNIDSCKEICTIIQTSLGPKGMNKLIINHINKKIVSSDCITILKDLEINHPVVNMLKNLSETMNYEYGDGTNYVFTLATEMLEKASMLIQQGFNVNDILHGFQLAHNKIKEILPELEVFKLKNFYDAKEIEKVIRPTMITKQFSTGSEIIVTLLAKCLATLMPKSLEEFDVDTIRVAKINGGTLVDSEIIMGMMLSRDTHGIVKRKENANVIVLNCGLEVANTETKGTVLLHNANELVNFTQGEEEHMEKIIESIKKQGVDVIIVNGPISDIAQHFCDMHNIMTIKVTSKFETIRLCKLFCISPMLRLEKPTHEEIGKAQSIYVSEIASKKVIVVNSMNVKIGTLVIRGATYNLLDEVERCIHDGINALKNAIKYNSFVYGGGCAEIQIAEKLYQYASELNGIDNYSVKTFAEAFYAIPQNIASNCGHKGNDALSELISEHRKNNTHACINIFKDSHITSAKKNHVYDNLRCKQHAIDLAVDAISTILKIDQIIMAKPAGGPKPRDRNPDFDA